MPDKHISKSVKHIHRPHPETGDESVPHRHTIALVGNPNVGKSVVFGYLTGIYADVSNYPGTTIEIMRGNHGDDVIIDTPGIYGVSSFNDEERVARDIVLDADIVINVVDAVHLERDLFLTLQIADMGIPMIIALNFMDEAQKEGMEINADLLSDLIGVPVIPTTATNHAGLEALSSAIVKARPGIPHPDISLKVAKTIREVGTRHEAILVLEGDEIVSARHGVPPGDSREELYLYRRARANDIVSHVVSETAIIHRMSTRLGQLTLNPFSGAIILALVLYILYYIIGVFIAQIVVGFTEKTIMQEHWEPMIRHLVYSFGWTHEGSSAGNILAGEFGVLTMSITYLFGLLLPLVLGFYLALAVLEDSGYLPRLAALTDRLLNGIGLNGRAVVPIILGFGCITMATITTRLLGTEREKTIATSILNFTIPCSAQLGVITLLLGRVGPIYALAYVLIIGICLVIVGTVMNKSLPGESSPLLINLPPMRLPRLDNVVRKSISRTSFFMREAYPWFIGGSFAVAVFQVTGLLTILQKLFAPLTVYWLQLPVEAANAFVMGMVRRDFGAAGFANMSLTPPQTLVAMVAITLFVPCIASVAILLKERSRKEAIMIWFGTWIAAFLVGGIVSQIIMR
ncbi:MAG: ferrous iron transport protein B [Armatimonadota bacterium]